jgi:hypothetical protein
MSSPFEKNRLFRQHRPNTHRRVCPFRKYPPIKLRTPKSLHAAYGPLRGCNPTFPLRIARDRAFVLCIAADAGPRLPRA